MKTKNLACDIALLFAAAECGAALKAIRKALADVMQPIIQHTQAQ